MNLRIITKDHTADPKVGSLLKIDFRADWTHESNPTAWELTLNLKIQQLLNRLRLQLPNSYVWGRLCEDLRP